MEMNVVGMAAEDREKWAKARLGDLEWTPEDDRLFPPTARAAARAASDAAEEGWRVVIGERRGMESVLEDPGTSWRWRAPSVLDVLETEVLREHITLFAARAAVRAACAQSSDVRARVSVTCGR